MNYCIKVMQEWSVMVAGKQQRDCCRGLNFPLMALLVIVLLITGYPAKAMVDDARNNLGQVRMIRPYLAEYEIFRRGSHLGSGLRKLKRTENGEWSFRYQTKMSFLFLSDERQEQSQFVISQPTVQQPEPTITSQRFRFERSGTGEDINTVVNFRDDGHVQRTREGEQPVDLTVEHPHFDQLNYQLQLQWDLLRGVPMTADYLSYAVIDRKARTKQYRFRYLDTETLTLPYGDVQAIKLTRVTDNPNRQTFIWMAPDLDFSLVRLMQIEDDKENYDVKLADFSFLSK